MAKTKLFDLISSLSMSEKRFFKLFSERHVIGSENEYVLLFDLIDKMSSYDDSEVKNAPFVKNASAEKNYLYRLILKSLNSFHAQNSTKNKIYNSLVSIEILFQKGLYDQSLELIEKTKKLAKDNELFKQLLSLNEIEQEVLLKSLKYKDALNEMEKEQETINQVLELRDIGMLTTKAYYENLTIGIARSEKQLEQYKQLLISQKRRKGSLSKRAELHKLSFQMTYDMIAGKHQQVINKSSSMIAFYEKHPYLIEYTPVGYVSVNFIYGAALRQNKMFKDGYEQIYKLEEIANQIVVKKSQKAHAFAVFYKHILYHQLLYLEKRYSDGLKLYAQTKEEIGTHINFIEKPQLYDLYFQLAKLFFMLGKHDLSLDYTNLILNDTSFKDRDDFSIGIRLFNIITHFELGNEFTSEYLSRSSVAYFRRKNKLYKTEKIILSFLQNYAKYEFDGSLVNKGKEILQSFNTLKKHPFEKGAFRFFAFDQWIIRLIPDIEKDPDAH